jgi:hypothetical protein
MMHPERLLPKTMEERGWRKRARASQRPCRTIATTVRRGLLQGSCQVSTSRRIVGRDPSAGIVPCTEEVCPVEEDPVRERGAPVLDIAAVGPLVGWTIPGIPSLAASDILRQREA